MCNQSENRDQQENPNLLMVLRSYDSCKLKLNYDLCLFPRISISWLNHSMHGVASVRRRNPTKRQPHAGESGGFLLEVLRKTFSAQDNAGESCNDAHDE